MTNLICLCRLCIIICAISLGFYTLFLSGWFRIDSSRSAFLIAQENFLIVNDFDSQHLSNENFRHHYDETKNSANGGRCTVNKCLDTLQCMVNLRRRLSVALQPILRFSERDSPLSVEYLELRSLIRNSDYYTADRSSACVVVPGFDTFQRISDSKVLSDFLELSRNSDTSSDILLFNPLGQDILKENGGRSISISAQFHYPQYRNEFDIAIPILRPHNIEQMNEYDFNEWDEKNLIFQNHRLINSNSKMEIFYDNKLLKIGIYMEDNGIDSVVNEEVILQLKKVKNVSIHLLHNCLSGKDRLSRCDDGGKLLSYYSIVAKLFDIVLISDETPIFEAIILDILQGGRTIPAILSDSYVPPFSEVLNWNRFSFILSTSFIRYNPTFLGRLNSQTLSEMRAQASRIYSQYFAAMSQILKTTFQILEQRIVSGTEPKTWDQWNLLPKTHNCILNSCSVGFVSDANQNLHLVLLFQYNVDDFQLEMICTRILNSFISNPLFMKQFLLSKATIFLPTHDTNSHTNLHFEGVNQYIKSINITLVRFESLTEFEQNWIFNYFMDDCIIVISGNQIVHRSNAWLNKYLVDSLMAWSERTQVSVFAHADLKNVPVLGISSSYNIYGLFKTLLSRENGSQLQYDDYNEDCVVAKILSPLSSLSLNRNKTSLHPIDEPVLKIFG